MKINEKLLSLNADLLKRKFLLRNTEIMFIYKIIGSHVALFSLKKKKRKTELFLVIDKRLATFSLKQKKPPLRKIKKQLVLQLTAYLKLQYSAKLQTQLSIGKKKFSSLLVFFINFYLKMFRN